MLLPAVYTTGVHEPGFTVRNTEFSEQHFTYRII